MRSCGHEGDVAATASLEARELRQQRVAEFFFPFFLSKRLTLSVAHSAVTGETVTTTYLVLFGKTDSDCRFHIRDLDQECRLCITVFQKR